MLKTSKKIVSVVLALVMVCSALSVMAFAAFDPASQTLGFVLVPDKDLTKVENGDDVTFTLYCDVADYSTLFSVMKLLFLYDSAAYTVPTSYSNLGDFAAFYKDGTPSSLNSSQAAWAKLPTGTTQDVSGFDTAFVIQGAVDNTKDYDGDGVMNNANAGYVMTQDDGTRSVAQLEFTFTVKDNTKNMDVMICDNFAATSTLQYFKTTTGAKQSNLPQAKVNTELASAMANNPAAEGTPVEFQKAQIRFKGITSTSGAATYEGTFDVRTVAQITEANFATYFTDEATAKAKITDFGFVYATKSNVATFDVDTAKGVAEGATAANYVKVPVTYMQHTGGNYIFTCLIANIADADKTDGVNCLGYVCFDGAYYYFDAAASVDFNTLYTAHMPA